MHPILMNLSGPIQTKLHIQHTRSQQQQSKSKKHKRENQKPYPRAWTAFPWLSSVAFVRKRVRSHRPSHNLPHRRSPLWSQRSSRSPPLPPPSATARRGRRRTTTRTTRLVFSTASSVATSTSTTKDSRKTPLPPSSSLQRTPFCCRF